MTQPVTFNRLLAVLDHTFASLPDRRRRPNTIYRMRDPAMAAFSVFFMQSPSFLAHQEVMQQTKGHSNAASLFGLERIPSDPQIRNLLDPLTPAALSAPFWDVFDILEEAGELGVTVVLRAIGWSRWMARNTSARPRSIASAAP